MQPKSLQSKPEKSLPRLNAAPLGLAVCNLAAYAMALDQARRGARVLARGARYSQARARDGWSRHSNITRCLPDSSETRARRSTSRLYGSALRRARRHSPAYGTPKATSVAALAR